MYCIFLQVTQTPRIYRSIYSQHSTISGSNLPLTPKHCIHTKIYLISTSTPSNNFLGTGSDTQESARCYRRTCRLASGNERGTEGAPCTETTSWNQTRTTLTLSIDPSSKAYLVNSLATLERSGFWDRCKRTKFTAACKHGGGEKKDHKSKGYDRKGGNAMTIFNNSGWRWCGCTLTAQDFRNHYILDPR